MTRIERTVLLPCSDRELFLLINDVKAYPQYMDGCVEAIVHYDNADEMEATLVLAKRGYRYQFTTRNRLTPYQHVSMSLVDGPFSDFAGDWHIQPLGEEGCKLTLTLAFTLKGPGLLTAALKPLFNTMADRLVDTIIKRVQQIQRGAV